MFYFRQITPVFSYQSPIRVVNYESSSNSPIYLFQPKAQSAEKARSGNNLKGIKL